MRSLPDNEFRHEQISVFLENRAGRLSEVMRLLAAAGVNIRAVSLADTSDFGILRMMVSDNIRAESVLKENGFTTGRTSVLAIELPDVPGSLDNLLQLLSAGSINVEYMYAYARRDLAKAVMIFRFDKIDQAISILKASAFELLPALAMKGF